MKLDLTRDEALTIISALGTYADLYTKQAQTEVNSARKSALEDLARDATNVLNHVETTLNQ